MSTTIVSPPRSAAAVILPSISHSDDKETAQYPPCSNISPPTVPEAEISIMQNFIENALDSKLQGDSQRYNYLLQHLIIKDTEFRVDSGREWRFSTALLARRKIFLALSRCLSRLVKDTGAYQSLFDTMFKYSFFTISAEISETLPAEISADMDSFVSFLLHLISYSSIFVVPALHMLAKNFLRLPELEGMEPQAWNDLARYRYDRVHYALEHVLRVAPTAINLLYSILCQYFPHKRLSACYQIAYLKNILHVSCYLPGTREQIIALCVDRLVQIDVEIKLDEDCEELVFSLDDFLQDDDATQGAAVDEMADKLDQMMGVLFEYLDQVKRSRNSDSRIEQVDQKDTVTHMFTCVLRAFERSIMNTHRSKHPQFLLFYMCRDSTKFQDIFISHLLSTSLDSQIPPVTRQNCGAYLASFLARAKFISPSYLEKAIYHQLNYLHNQLDAYDAQKAETANSLAVELEPQAISVTNCSSSRNHFTQSIYVATLQTACYVICFRGLEMAKTVKGYEFLRSLGWERLLTTLPTNPLALCEQSVACEFLNIAELLHLVSIETIERLDKTLNACSKSLTTQKASMERTKRLAAIQHKPLQTFFPFDPYLLRHSFKYIGPLYLYWKHVDPMSSENADSLSNVKQIITSYEQEESEEESTDGEELDDASVTSLDTECTGSVADQRDLAMDTACYDSDDATYILATKQRRRKIAFTNRTQHSPALDAIKDYPSYALPPFVLSCREEEDEEF